LEIQLILERAAEESERKSVRCGAAWKEKRRKARENGTILTRRLPAWVEVRGGKLALIPERAAVVKRIFALAAAGYGFGFIVKTLTEEGVPAFNENGKAGAKQTGWIRSYIARILTDRRALGTFHPCDTNRKPDGPPIPNYFPAAVTEDEWLAARAGLSQRKGKRGRVSERINLFAGLVRNAADGTRYYATTRQSGNGTGQDRSKAALLITSAAANGRGAARSFPLDTFEAAVLSQLREINPRDVLPAGDDGPDETDVLAGELARVEDELTEAAEFMEANGFSPTIGKRVQALEDRKRDLEAELRDARARATCPAAAAWEGFGSLADALGNAPNPTDARLRLRAALRRVVSEIWLLVVPRGSDRLCAVQVFFAGGARRDYLIWHRPHRNNGKARKEGWWKARSITAEEMAAVGLKLFGGDLRDPDEVAATVRTLEKLPAEMLEGPVFGAYPAHPLGA
jgi:hypothetical protein